MIGFLIGKTMKYLVNTTPMSYIKKLSVNKKTEENNEDQKKDSLSAISKEKIENILCCEFFTEGVNDKLLSKQYNSNKLIPLLTNVQKNYKSMLKDVKEEYIARKQNSEQWEASNNITNEDQLKDLVKDKKDNDDNEYDVNAILCDNLQEKQFYKIFFKEIPNEDKE